MKRRDPVSKIMTDHLFTINLSNTLEDAYHLMEKNKFHHLPVVSGNEIVGMISKSDLLRVSYIEDYQNSDVTVTINNALSVEKVMTKNPITVQADTTIREAAETLTKQEFHALPVLEGEHLVGILTSTDLIKYLLEQY